VEERWRTAECVIGCEVHSVADEAGVVDEVAGMKSASVDSRFELAPY
jgi:hypothetical protein